MSNFAPWLEIARNELGVTQFPKGQSNPRITEYHDCTNIAGYDDKAAWCSSFLNWCLKKCEVDGTSSALARSWLDWGEPLHKPKLGCIVVVTRDDPESWKGHVGFYLESNNKEVILLGGNQLGKVCENSYDLKSVLAYRWPTSS